MVLTFILEQFAVNNSVVLCRPTIHINDFVKAKMWLFFSILNKILCRKKKKKIVG